MPKSGRIKVKKGVDGKTRCFPLGVNAERPYARIFGFLGESPATEAITGSQSCDMRAPGRRCRITQGICPRRNVSPGN